MNGPSRHWYALEGQVRGPATLQDLAGLHAAGVLSDGTPVWSEDGAGPRALREVLGRGAPRDERTVRELLGEYLSPREMVPLLLSSRFWALYAIAAGPMLLLAVGAADPVSWLFFYFSLVWAVLFHRLVSPDPRSGALAVLLYVATVTFTVPALLAWLSVPPFVTDVLIAAPSPLLRLVGFVGGVGVREEAFKVLPLAALAAWRRVAGRRLSLRQGIFLGAICGLAFAAAENLEYLAQFEAHDRMAYRLGVFSQQSLEGTLSRLLLTPFMHGAWSGIAGYFVAWAELQRRSRWTFRLAGLAGTALLHGVYDFLAAAPVLALVVIAFTFHVLVRCMARASNEASGLEHLERRMA